MLRTLGGHRPRQDDTWTQGLHVGCPSTHQDALRNSQLDYLRLFAVRLHDRWCSLLHAAGTAAAAGGIGPQALQAPPIGASIRPTSVYGPLHFRPSVPVAERCCPRTVPSCAPETTCSCAHSCVPMFTAKYVYTTCAAADQAASAALATSVLVPPRFHWRLHAHIGNVVAMRVVQATLLRSKRASNRLPH